MTMTMNMRMRMVQHMMTVMIMMDKMSRWT